MTGSTGCDAEDLRNMNTIQVVIVEVFHERNDKCVKNEVKSSSGSLLRRCKSDWKDGVWLHKKIWHGGDYAITQYCLHNILW